MISFFGNLSIGRKINTVLLLTSLTAMTAMGTALWGFQSRSFQRNLEANLLSIAMIIADNSASSLIFDDQDAAIEILASLDNIPGFSSAMLHGKNKTVLATHGIEDSIVDAVFVSEWLAGYAQAGGSDATRTVVFGEDFAFVNHPIQLDGDQIGHLHMIFSLAPLAAQKILLTRFMGLLFLGTLILVSLFGHRFQQLISRPLIQLAETAALISEKKDYAIRVDVTSRDETGKLTEAFNTMLTTIQRHEKSMVQSIKEADRANQAKGQFLANMSHEIRTPMNGIIGMSDLLIDSGLSAEQKDNLEIIQHSAEQLLTIINEILDFSKVESGNIQLENDPFDLPRIVETVAKMIAPTASHKGLKITTVIAPDVPERVTGDPVRLRQILINMVGNAVKFTTEGKIEIRVKTLLAANESARLRFEIVDQGIGIPVEQHERVFSQFTQVDDSNTRSYGGTGLGLAICKLLVELMGGDIGVTSTVGKGSTFWFEIEMPVLMAQDSRPLATEATTDELEMAPDEHCPESRILVAEDNTINQLVITKTLMRLNCSVDIAENGKEAVAMLRGAHTPYDLVFMDCQMPVMDGYEATGIIRSLPGQVARTPIIALTAAAMPEDRVKALAARMDDYLTKPVKLSMLRATLKKWIWMSMATAPAKVEPEQQLAQPLVLVVEDNLTNQKVVCSLLKKLDCRIVVAADGIQAVECVQAATVPFDIVFMDCHMPNMDGYEATRAIRGLPDSSGQMPIVALTATSSEEDIAKCFASGMNAHLVKPARKKALRGAIEKWVNATIEMSPS